MAWIEPPAEMLLSMPPPRGLDGSSSTVTVPGSTSVVELELLRISLLALYSSTFRAHSFLLLDSFCELATWTSRELTVRAASQRTERAKALIHILWARSFSLAFHSFTAELLSILKCIATIAVTNHRINHCARWHKANCPARIRRHVRSPTPPIAVPRPFSPFPAPIAVTQQRAFRRPRVLLFCLLVPTPGLLLSGSGRASLFTHALRHLQPTYVQMHIFCRAPA